MSYNDISVGTQVLPFARRAAMTLLVLTVLAAGCADMPIVAPPPGEDAPIGSASMAFGPYLTSADGKQPVFRFITNRRCVAGIQALDRRDKRVNRQGSFSLFHALTIPELEPSVLKRYQLWLDDSDGGIYRIRGLPRSGQAVNLAFAGGQADPVRLAAAGREFRHIDPDAVVFVSPPFGGGPPEKAEDWAVRLLDPLGNVTELGPLWFVPGSGIPRDLYPEHNDEGGYWKRDVGALRLIGIDARAFNFESSRNALMARLDRDLDPQHRERAWTVVVLSRPVFDARVGDGRILEALGDRLELGGVDLVIGGGAPYYLRTRPFSISGRGQTRYISMADATTGIAGIQPREYVAVMSGAPHVARLWADEGTLEWQALDHEGRPIDIVTLDIERRPIETTLPKWDILTDAQATLTLQKEVLKITRQAAKAVGNPTSHILMPLYFANPSTKRFAGTLAWEVPPGSGWRIEPMTMPFDLQPGQGAVARFGITPGTEGTYPMLTATAIDVGSSRDSLVLTREKVHEVRTPGGTVRIDGRVRDKDYWKTLPALLGFENAATGAPAANPVEGRVAADRRGLILAFSMAAELASTVNPAASDPEQHRDGPVMSDESIEIWLDPARRGREYYRFAINPRNVVYDESSRDGQAFNPQWQHVTRFGRAGGQETWNVEMRIPWEALDLAGPPDSGAEWGMQIVRRDYSASRVAAQKRTRDLPPPEITQWVPTLGSNTRSGLYGVLRFGDMTFLSEPESEAAEPESRSIFMRGGRLPSRPGTLLPPPPPSDAPPVPEPPAPDL